MAGRVRLRVSAELGHMPYELVPQLCPVSGLAERPACVQMDPWAGRPALCPFLLRVRAYVGSTSEDLTAPDDIERWLLSDQLDGVREYWAICLRKESAGVLPGATTRFWE